MSDTTGLIKIINDSWSWTGATADAIIRTNEFGNIVFRSTDRAFWRICPEELSCEMIAEDRYRLNRLFLTSEFLEDWRMKNLVDLARKKLGDLAEGEKFCLKIPAVLGGQYDAANLGKVAHVEQIAFAGDLGCQIRNRPDGQKIALVIDEDND